MKESYYNFFYDIENESQMLAYNSRTNALALINKEDKEKIPLIVDGNTDSVDKKLIEDLKYGGFLIDDDLDELKLLRYNQQVARFDSSSLGLTIAPTMGCNFDCIYCYEHDHDDFTKMGQDVQDAIVKLLESQKETLNRFNVTWYGGEPLLAFDVIEKLSERFISICNSNNITYDAGIITNGYLLTNEKAKRMKGLKINSIQVTIDGPEDIHDERRYLKGKKPTFQKIINNLKELPDDAPSIALRINTDEKNSSRVSEIIQILTVNGLLKKVHPYLGYVEATNNEYNQNLCLSFRQFTKVESEFNLKLHQKNMQKYPELRGNYCTADKMNSLVIAPNGDICKCWSDIGLKEYQIGNVKTGIQHYKMLLEYSLYDSTQDEECKNCKLLPICMGGCPRRRLDGMAERCSSYKYTLEKELEKVVKTSYKT